MVFCTRNEAKCPITPLLRRLCGKLQCGEDFTASAIPYPSETKEVLYRVRPGGGESVCLPVNLRSKLNRAPRATLLHFRCWPTPAPLPPILRSKGWAQPPARSRPTHPEWYAPPLAPAARLAKPQRTANPPAGPQEAIAPPANRDRAPACKPPASRLPGQAAPRGYATGHDARLKRSHSTPTPDPSASSQAPPRFSNTSVSKTPPLNTVPSFRLDVAVAIPIERAKSPLTCT